MNLTTNFTIITLVILEFIPKIFFPIILMKKKFKKNISQFYKKATEVLKRRNNLIFNPEGVSSTTENSPGKFKAEFLEWQ